MKILILGRNGQVAQELQKSCVSLGEISVLGSEQASFLLPDAILQYIKEYRPTHIVNAAAYTAVDRAETEEAQARQINATTVGLIAEQAKAIGACLLHYSTDYVFDGAKSSPFVETDECRPLNAYGRTKLLGEQHIQDVDGDFVILRISWVYGQHGNNFYRTMLRLGYEREELKIVDDQIGAPTWSREIARASTTILQNSQLKDKSGLYHLSPQGRTSWCGFAQKIFSLQGQLHPELPLKAKRVLPIATEEYPTPAVRPRNSLMNSDKLKNAFNLQLPSWDDSLQQMMKE
jgi:dTDP-4-dehydrorhamnose reductase